MENIVEKSVENFRNRGERMNPRDYVPSPRVRISNLVQNHARRTGASIGKTWSTLYEEFEYRTNKPWRKMAYNNGQTPMDAIHALRRMDEFLELARELLAPAADPTDTETQEATR